LRRRLTRPILDRLSVGSRTPSLRRVRLPDAIGSTAVTGSTTRWMVLSKVAPEERAAALLGLRVIGKQSKPTFALIAKGFELRHQVAHAGFEAVGRHRNINAAFQVALNERCLLKIGHQHPTNPCRYSRRVGKGLRRRGALLARPSSERVFQALQMPNAWTTERLKVLLDFKVRRVEQEDAVGRVPIAPGAPDLLNILLQRPGSLVVQDVADVRLVDAHAECACCDHDQPSRRIHELTLRCVSIGGTHLPVIARNRDTRAAECARDLINRGGRGAIDDPRALQTLDAPGGGAEFL
jgi:hypothetical protein